MAARPDPNFTDLNALLLTSHPKRRVDADADAEPEAAPYKRVASANVNAHHLLVVNRAVTAARFAMQDCATAIGKAQLDDVECADESNRVAEMLNTLDALQQTVSERRNAAAWQRAAEIFTEVDPRDKCALTNALSHVIRDTANERDRRIVWAVCRELSALFPPK